jgi:predicted nucleic acid-binding protein
LRIAYVDTSCLLALAFSEPGWEDLAESLGNFDVLISSPLLQAEFLSALAREGSRDDHYLAWIEWFHPGRDLGAECRDILDHGFLRGADLWHMACAVALRENVESLAFLTLDERQRSVAVQLRFSTAA